MSEIHPSVSMNLAQPSVPNDEDFKESSNDTVPDFQSEWSAEFREAYFQPRFVGLRNVRSTYDFPLISISPNQQDNGDESVHSRSIGSDFDSVICAGMSSVIIFVFITPGFAFDMMGEDFDRRGGILWALLVHESCTSRPTP